MTLSGRLLSLYLKRAANGMPTNRALKRILRHSVLHNSNISEELAAGVAKEVTAGRADSDLIARIGTELPMSTVHSLVVAIGEHAGTNGVLQVRNNVTNDNIRKSTAKWLKNTFDIEQLRVCDLDPENKHLIRTLTDASRRRSPQPVSDENEFHARLLRKDTRMFVAFHDALGDAPLAWVECALRNNIPRNVNEVLEQPYESEANVCVFYSLATVQRTTGRLGIAATLIRTAIKKCSENDNPKRFVTMSPIPGYRKWATSKGGVDEIEAMKLNSVEQFLNEGRCPVGRFHTGNGAVLIDILRNADLSPKRKSESMGIMAVYEYVL